MGIKTTTEVTCDWCGEVMGSDEKLGFGSWTWSKECTKIQRVSVACSDMCRMMLDQLQEAMAENKLEKESIRLFVVTPPGFDGEESRTLLFELSPCTIKIDWFRDFTITGTIKNGEVVT